MSVEKIAKKIKEAERKNKKIAMFHFQALLYAEEFRGVDAVQFCKDVGMRDSFATEFRDGMKNLHYFHITKSGKGRNCIVCHDIHGSETPKMIRESSRFGDWQMQINYSKNTTGGSCAPGCHRLRSYSREITK